MSERGRPSKFRPEFVDQAKKLCELGATDREIAHFFKVKERTIYRWILQSPDFCQALKMGKEVADERVERSLYRKAIGYTFDSVHISNYQGVVAQTPIVEHVPPDTTAAIFWLKNRRPAQWRDIRAIEHTGEVLHRHAVELTEEELERIATGRSEGAAEQTQGSEQSPPVH